MAGQVESLISIEAVRTASRKRGPTPNSSQLDRARFDRGDAARADQKIRLQPAHRHANQIQRLDPAPDQRPGRGHGDAAFILGNGEPGTVADMGEELI